MIETTQDEALWTQWCARAGVRDPYWSWSHLALWAPEWSAAPLGVRWSSGEDAILHPVLRVPLDGLPGGEGRFDLRTAYDFAGPLHVGPGARASMDRFEGEWTAWAREAGAVTEFLRLHPFALPVVPSWASLHAHNHVVELGHPYEEIRRAYHPSWRRNLRKAERAGLEVEVTRNPSPDRVAAFLALYAEAMERLEAPWEFRFRSDTLRRFLGLPESSLVTVVDPRGAPVAMATVLASGSTLFYHLGCSDPGALAHRPNHLLFDGLVRMGLEGGFHSVHLGGGSASLQRFKSQLASGTVPYYLVKRVLDPEAYAGICRETGVDPRSPIFPAYVGRLTS